MAAGGVQIESTMALHKQTQGTLTKVSWELEKSIAENQDLLAVKTDLTQQLSILQMENKVRCSLTRRCT